MEQLLNSFYIISAFKNIKKKWEISEEKYAKLYLHQVKGLVFMLNQHLKNENCILDLDARMGRAVLVCMFLDTISTSHTRPLIICDRNVMENWSSHVTKWTNLKPIIIRETSDISSFTSIPESIVIISPKKLKEMSNRNWDFVIIDNVESSDALSSRVLQSYNGSKTNAMIILLTNIGIRTPSNREMLWIMLNFISSNNYKLPSKKKFLSECLCNVENQLTFPGMDNYLRITSEMYPDEPISGLDPTILKEYFTSPMAIDPNCTVLKRNIIEEDPIPCTLKESPKFKRIISKIDQHSYFFHENNEFLTPNCYEQRKFLNQNLNEFEPSTKKQKLNDEGNKSLTTDNKKPKNIDSELDDVETPNPHQNITSLTEKMQESDNSNQTKLPHVTNSDKQSDLKPVFHKPDPPTEWNLDSFFNRAPIRSNKKLSPNYTKKTEIQNNKDPIEEKISEFTTKINLQPMLKNENYCSKPLIVDSQTGNASKILDDYESCLDKSFFNRPPIRSTKKVSPITTKTSKPFEINNFLCGEVEKSIKNSTTAISVDINLQPTNQNSSNSKISCVNNELEKAHTVAEGGDYESCLDNFFNRKVIRVRSGNLNTTKSSSANTKE